MTITPVALIYNFLLWCLWVAGANLGLRRRFSLPVSLCVELACFIPWFYLTAAISKVPSIIKTAFGMGFIIILFFFMSQGKWYIRLIYTTLLTTFMIVGEMLTFLLVPSQLAEPGSQIPYDYNILIFAIGFLVNVILYSMLVLVWNAIRQRYTFGIVAPQMLFLVGIPVMLHLIIYAILSIIWRDGHGAFSSAELILLFGTITGNMICLFVLIKLAAKDAAETEKLRIRQESAAIEEQQLAALSSEEEKLSALKMSLSKQFSDIALELESNTPPSAAEASARIMSDPLFERRFPACENRVIADFLTHRENAIKEKSISTDFSATLPMKLSITNPDLISAFGNLIDNAEEACISVSDPFIRLKADYQKPYVRIKLENSFSPEPDSRRLFTEKPERGLGMRILSQLASQYDGEYRTETKGNTWHATLLMKGAL